MMRRAISLGHSSSAAHQPVRRQFASVMAAQAKAADGWKPLPSLVAASAVASSVVTSAAAGLLRRSSAPPPSKPPTQGGLTPEPHHQKKKNNQGDEDEDDDDDEAGPDMSNYTRVAWHLVFGVTGSAIVLYFLSRPAGSQTNWSYLLHEDSILARIRRIHVYHYYAQLTLDDGQAYIGLNPENTGETDAFVDIIMSQRTATDLQFNNRHAQPVVVSYEGTSYSQKALEILSIVAWVIPFVFTPLYVTFLSQATGTALRASLKTLAKGQGEDKTKNAAKLFKVTKRTDIRFKDIAGMTEPKAEVAEIVDFLRNPDRYVKMGAKIPSGAMLLGPPGTGKTLLAKAVAGESDVAFIPCVGSDFVEMYVGMGALRVRKLFELAKQQPKCIVYIDEIDAIGLKRGGGSGGGEKQEQEHTLNELLTQLDGFSSTNDKVIVLASSNVDQSQLDPALIRPGRFDRLVHVEAPVISERIDIFKYHLGKLKLLADEVLPDPNAPVPTTTATAESTPAAPAASGATVEANAETTTTPADDNKTRVVDQVASTSPDSAAAPSPPPPTASASDAASASPAATVDSTTNAATAAATPSSAEKTAADTEEATPTTEVVAPLTKKEELIADYAKRMSDLCPGFVGADIANVCNESAILAARCSATHVTIDHLEKSIDRVLAGIEHRSRVMSDFEKNVVAHHEAGHAVAGWFLNRADPLMKVSIVPRGGKALGYAQYLPNENMQRSSDDILDSICVTLGGRVAEAIFFDHLSTGASDDLQKVTRMAYSHVSSFNRSAAYAPPNSQHLKQFGEATGAMIDDSAKALVDRAYQRTYDLLLKHKADMQALAEHLLKHEVLTHADVVALLGARPLRTSERKQH